MTKIRQFPKHIVEMAAAITRGELVEPMLADALEEIGCDAMASHFRPEVGWHSLHHSANVPCSVSNVIVAGQIDDWSIARWPLAIIADLGLASACIEDREIDAWPPAILADLGIVSAKP